MTSLRFSKSCECSGGIVVSYLLCIVSVIFCLCACCNSYILAR